MISFKRIGFSALAALSLAGPGVASAAPVQWSLSYSNPGAYTLGGSFVYDAATSSFSAINVTGVDLAGNNYVAPSYTLTDPLDNNTASRFTFWESLASDRTGARFIVFFIYSDPLQGTGGTIGLAATNSQFVQAFVCANPACTSTISNGVIETATGSLTGVPLRVPEPGTLALLSLGVAGIVAARRKAARLA